MTRTRVPTSSRTRILAAARLEFADRGFDGTSVDRIAARARLNKAMIYYHFASKAALYREIVAQMFQAIAEQVTPVADRQLSPQDKVRGFIEAVAAEIGRRPYLRRIMLRELAEFGRHLDRQTLQIMSEVPSTFGRIVAEGRRTHVFGDTSPLLVYFTIIGTLVFHFASEPVRTQLFKLDVLPIPQLDTAVVVAYAQRLALDMLTDPTRQTPVRAGDIHVIPPHS